MADGSKVLDQARSLIEERLKELDDERKRLERALADLKGTRRGPGRPRGSSAPSASGSGRKRRRRRGGTRSDQALKQVQENPGIRASEIASKLNIKPNYVYRVMSDLEKDGKVSKQGREYHPVAS
ncbi:MAG: winged helix-turn-helix domain-containing protein [Solirubrobacterales bacterium]|nr:winged helix-turn-helix domain-containing protein [Thermoleophilales bacterium]MCO5326158.1 winged helix-turn-helix domain-containing protein [Solirubrobacterales bacterium]